MKKLIILMLLFLTSVCSANTPDAYISSYLWPTRASASVTPTTDPYPAFPTGAIVAIDAYTDTNYVDGAAMPTLSIYAKVSRTITNNYRQTAGVSHATKKVPTDNYAGYLGDGGNDHYLPLSPVAKTDDVSVVFYGQSLSKTTTGLPFAWSNSAASTFYHPIQFNNDNSLTIAYAQSTAGNFKYYSMQNMHTTTPCFIVVTLHASPGAVSCNFNGVFRPLPAAGVGGTVVGIAEPGTAFLRNGANSNFYFKGWIGVFIVYDRLLTRQEILNCWTAVKARSATLGLLP